MLVENLKRVALQQRIFYPLARTHVYLHVTNLAGFGEKVC